MKFDQLAIACNSLDRQRLLVRHLTDNFGANFAVEDYVIAQGLDHQRNRIRNIAVLKFDYSTWPMEYEILTYVEGWNWHRLRREFEFTWLSHYGMHIKSEEENEPFRKKYHVLQEVMTVEHSNPACADRRYHYVIYDTISSMGCALKTIRRVSLAESAAWVADL